MRLYYHPTALTLSLTGPLFAGHIHGLLWIEDAPIYGVDEDQIVCDFIDQYVSCTLPTEEEDKELHDLLAMQTHNHTDSCQKKSVKDAKRPEGMSDADWKLRLKDLKCRFNFPRPVSDHTHIEMDLADKMRRENASHSKLSNMKQTTKGKIILKRDENSRYINNFNKACLRLWRANMDIQYVVNVYAAIRDVSCTL